MRTHLQVLGWLHFATHILYALGGASVLMLGSALAAAVAATGGHTLMPLAALVAAGGWIIAAVLLCMGLPGVIIGWGLAMRSEWARIPGIILSILNLAVFPFGTALGVYGLAVLFHPESEAILQPRAIAYR